MRLIDADALETKAYEIYVHASPEFKTRMNTLKALIDQAPTIDAAPVVHSRWVDCEGHTFAPVGSRCYCYNCHFYDNATYNWCHGCGAKMDAEEEL